MKNESVLTFASPEPNPEPPTPAPSRPTNPPQKIDVFCRGEKIGELESIALDSKNYTLVFTGVLVREITDQNLLIKLLLREGVHLGKP